MKIKLQVHRLIDKYAPHEKKYQAMDLVNWVKDWAAKKGIRLKIGRHLASDFLQGREVKNVSLEMLNCLCDFLVEECNVPTDQLPERLFGRQEQELLSLLGETPRLQLVLGVRRAEEWGENPYVMATDFNLQSTLTNLVFRHANRGLGGQVPLPKVDYVEAPSRFLGRSPKDQTPEAQEAIKKAKKHWKESCDRAAKLFEDICKYKKSTTIITGSIKVNCIAEHYLAWTFSEVPLKSQTKQVRKVPIYFRFRDTDPKPVSCCAGTSSPLKEDDRPGIHYESVGGWECLPCDDKEVDAGFVSFVQKGKQRFLALGGFSSRATYYLTQELEQLSDRFWPPQYEDEKKKVGLFLLKFRFETIDAVSGVDNPVLPFPKLKEAEVIPLDPEVMQQKMKGQEET